MKNLKLKIENNISNFIKRLIFLSIICIFNFNYLYSQCKLETLKDKFSSTQSYYSKDVTLKNYFPVGAILIGSTNEPWNLVLSFWFSQDNTPNSTIIGTVSISVTHESQSFASELSSIYFKFTDGSIIRKETPGKSGKFTTGFGYDYKYTGFDLTIEELEIFASKDLLSFQAVFLYFPTSPTVDGDIKSNNVSRIKKDASCILEQYNSDLNSKKKAIAKEGSNAKEINDKYKYICGYDNDKIDAFTKKRNVVTKPAAFLDIATKDKGRDVLSITGSNIDGTNGLKFYIAYILYDIAKIPEADIKAYTLFDQVDILLDNDEVITLKSEEVSEYLRQNIAAYTYKLFTIENDSIWQKLKSHPIKTLRYSIKGKELRTNDIDLAHSKSIINVINCIDALNITKAK